MLKILQSPYPAIGLLVLLMGLVVGLAYLKKRQLIKEWTGVGIIVVVFLLALFALTVNIE
jgi:hypothetical protein